MSSYGGIPRCRVLSRGKLLGNSNVQFGFKLLRFASSLHRYPVCRGQRIPSRRVLSSGKLF